ncbi:MAG: PQQ-binding-like beta-propeller repeat protein, partial [Anaerolineae bacterium]|nr:PQQ-binding-like beta-propeller repeat protein [Anaerolineae bacterium]
MNAVDGTLNWSYQTGGWVWSSPAVSGGVVYVGSDDGCVYAFAEACTVTFSASGLGRDASGTVLTVDGADYGYKDLPTTLTWPIGSSHSFAWRSTVSAGSDRRYVWTKTTGLSTARSGSIKVPDGDSLVQASYRPQYYLTVKSPYGSPTGQGWYNPGSTVSSSVTSPVSPSTGTQQVCKGWTGTGA